MCVPLNFATVTGIPTSKTELMLGPALKEYMDKQNKGVSQPVPTTPESVAARNKRLRQQRAASSSGQSSGQGLLTPERPAVLTGPGGAL